MRSHWPGRSGPTSRSRQAATPSAPTGWHASCCRPAPAAEGGSRRRPRGRRSSARCGGAPAGCGPVAGRRSRRPWLPPTGSSPAGPGAARWSGGSRPTGPAAAAAAPRPRLPWVPMTAVAPDTARSAPTRTASDAMSSARSRSLWRWVAVRSEKLKSVSQGWPASSTITLAARRARWAIPARCSLSTSAHSRWRTSSLILSAGSRSSELPSTRSMASSAVPSAALITRSTRGTRTPACSAIVPTRAWCSTAWISEAAGRVSPTSRSRANRYARYSRSASR